MEEKKKLTVTQIKKKINEVTKYMDDEDFRIEVGVWDYRFEEDYPTIDIYVSVFSSDSYDLIEDIEVISIESDNEDDEELAKKLLKDAKRIAKTLSNTYSNIKYYDYLLNV